MFLCFFVLFVIEIIRVDFIFKVRPFHLPSLKLVYQMLMNDQQQMNEFWKR